MHRETILKAMHPTCIFSNIAPNGTGNLRRWVWRIIQSVGLSRLGHLNVAYPGLHSGCARKLIHLDRKSTRLNSSHVASSYAVFCLKKKNTPPTPEQSAGPT